LFRGNGAGRKMSQTMSPSGRKSRQSRTTRIGDLPLLRASPAIARIASAMTTSTNARMRIAKDFASSEEISFISVPDRPPVRFDAKVTYRDDHCAPNERLCQASQGAHFANSYNGPQFHSRKLRVSLSVIRRISCSSSLEDFQKRGNRNPIPGAHDEFHVREIDTPWRLWQGSGPNSPIAAADLPPRPACNCPRSMFFDCGASSIYSATACGGAGRLRDATAATSTACH